MTLKSYGNIYFVDRQQQRQQPCLIPPCSIQQKLESMHMYMRGCPSMKRLDARTDWLITLLFFNTVNDEVTG